MTMANTEVLGAPVERLRSLTDTDVTVTTLEGSFRGTVLSCTRLSVWLVCGDDDAVVALDEIVRVDVHDRAVA